MGTISVSANANIFVAAFKNRYICPFIRNISVVCLQLIDDIFMMWKEKRDWLQTSLKPLNEQHPKINFYFKVSKEEIDDSKNTKQQFTGKTEIVKVSYIQNLKT